MLLPNYVQIDAGRMTAGSPRYPSSILHELGTRIVGSKVRTAIEAQRALARGADLLAGEYYGRASSEVRFSVDTRQTVECGGDRFFRRDFFASDKVYHAAILE